MTIFGPTMMNVSSTPQPSSVSWSSSSSFNFNTDFKKDIICDGEIWLKDKPLSEILDKIESRLAILIPDPEKLEKFEALKKAYEQYKIIEALCCADEPK